MAGVWGQVPHIHILTPPHLFLLPHLHRTYSASSRSCVCGDLPLTSYRSTQFTASPAQDFFGVIEELRVWRVVRSAQQIREGMEADVGRGPGEEGRRRGKRWA